MRFNRNIQVHYLQYALMKKYIPYTLINEIISQFFVLQQTLSHQTNQFVKIQFQNNVLYCIVIPLNRLPEVYTSKTLNTHAEPTQYMIGNVPRNVLCTRLMICTYPSMQNNTNRKIKLSSQNTVSINILLCLFLLSKFINIEHSKLVNLNSSINFSDEEISSIKSYGSS